MVSIWEKVHETLQSILAREVSLRQEILSNLSQQEYALLTGDVWLREALNRESSGLICNLRTLTGARGNLTRQLVDISPLVGSEDKLEQMLDPTHEIEGETYLLHQKVCALVGKIRHKHLHIKRLLAMLERGKAYSHINCSALPLEPPYKLKGRPPSLVIVEHPKGCAE